MFYESLYGIFDFIKLFVPINFKVWNWKILLNGDRDSHVFLKRNHEKIIFIVIASIIKTSYRYFYFPSVFIFMIHYYWMTDPILFISMILGLGGVFVLINSFGDDDDSDNDGGMGTYIYNLEPIKVGSN